MFKRILINILNNAQEPESFSTKVSVKKYDTSTTNTDFQCKMKQISANTNDATTGHKLQGMSKDVIIVVS
jgi:hypothetical protein